MFKIIFRVNFTDVDATTGMLTAYERDRKDKVWKGVSLKQNYIACKFIVNKVRCVFPMVIVSILTNVEFGLNDHREGAPYFISIV